MAHSWLLSTSAMGALCCWSGAAVATEPGHWTGFYYGMNAGYHWTDVETNLTSTPFNPGNAFIVGLARAAQVWFGRDHEGFTGGIQTGASWAMGSILIAGVEADIQGLSGSAFVTTTSPGTDLQLNTELDFLATARGRMGVLILPSLLLYGTGGLAVGFAHSDFGITQTALAAQDGGTNQETLVGWTVGAGIERFYQGSWSLRAEYLYYDLGDIGTSVTVRNQDVGVGDPPIPYMRSITGTPINGNIARVSLTFRLN